MAKKGTEKNPKEETPSKMTNTYLKELTEIVTVVTEAISKVLLSKDRTSKHPPYTWLDEDEEQHLLKAARHINTYLQIKNKYQKPDGEDHLNNAITRLSMAIAKKSTE